MNKEIEDILKKIPDEVEFIPDRDLFKKLFFDQNPQGDINRAYELLIFSIETENNNGAIRPEDNKKYTFKYFVKKYDRYLIWWKSTYGDVEQRFVSKDNKLKNIIDWFDESEYRNMFTLSKSHLDDYLFGGFSEEVLERKLRIFNTILGKDNYDATTPVEIVDDGPIESVHDDENPF